MKKKVGTLVEESLLRIAKTRAAQSGLALNDIINQALEQFLSEAQDSRKALQVVKSTWGALKISKSALASILEEDLYGPE